MDELLKIAANGQWTLEKAKLSSQDMQRMVEQFVANKTKKEAAPSAPPVKNPMQGLRPAQSSAGENPLYSKEEVARIRAGIPPEQIAATKAAAGIRPTPSDQEKHIDKMRGKFDTERAALEEQAKATQNRKAAWEATTKFLGDRGGEEKVSSPEAKDKGYGYGIATGGPNKGWASINGNLQTQKKLNDAQKTGKPVEGVKRQLMPPMEMVRDEKGNPSMQSRKGRFHGEGAQTAGKIVHTRVSYPDKQTGEMRYTSIPQQEIHHWAWDHSAKKWNHVKTTRGSGGG